MNNNYVVYQHRRLDNNQIFYVGQGLLSRAYQNQVNRRNTNWIKVVKEAGGFIVDILKEGLSKEESLIIESEYIKKYGTIKHNTGILVNERLSGSRGVKSGYTHSEEKRKEISEKTKKAMQNPETKKRLIESHLKYWENSENHINASISTKGVHAGSKHPMYGKTHSEESKDKMSKAKLGKKRSLEAIEKLKKRIPWNKGLKGAYKQKQETIEKRKNTLKNRPYTPQKKVECPYCKLIGGFTNMKRYHFDNCKNK